MKTFVHLIVILLFFGPVSAQELDFNFGHQEKKEFSIQWLKALKTQLEPTFVGLFQKDFNRIETPIKWQNIYDDTDLGLKCNLFFQINEKLRLVTHYLLGVLNLDKRGFGQASGYRFQVSICYKI